MRKTQEHRRLALQYTAIALAIVFLLSTALLLLGIWEKRQGSFPVFDVEETHVKYNGAQYALNENIETFLVMGLDKFEGTAVADSYNNDQQADFLMLMVLDNEKRQCSAIHINRDTMADISVLGVAGQEIAKVNKQIALAHTYGNGREVSCRNTADAVSELLLGVKVNHYISFTMDSVATINDLVGGVAVTLLEDFTSVDPAMVKGERMTLMGRQALHYVRTRYGLEDSSNSTRMQRQQQYLKALYEKIQQRMDADEEFVVEASVKMADYIVSDRSITRLQELLKKFSEYEFTGIRSMEGENVVGEKFIEFYPKKDSVEKVVIDTFYTIKE